MTRRSSRKGPAREKYKTSRESLPSHATHPQAKGDQLLCWFEDDTEDASLSINVQKLVRLPFLLTILAANVVFVGEIETKLAYLPSHVPIREFFIIGN